MELLRRKAEIAIAINAANIDAGTQNLHELFEVVQYVAASQAVYGKVYGKVLAIRGADSWKGCAFIPVFATGFESATTSLFHDSSLEGLCLLKKHHRTDAAFEAMFREWMI